MFFFYVEHATVLYHSKQLLFLDLDSQKGTSIYWSKYFLSAGRLDKNKLFGSGSSLVSPCGLFTGYLRIEWRYLLLGLLLIIIDFLEFEYLYYFDKLRNCPFRLRLVL